MIHDDFDNVVKMLDPSNLTNVSQIQEALNKVTLFVRRVNEEFDLANQEEKLELLKMLSEMQNKLNKNIKMYCEQSGLTEDQLLNFAFDNTALSTQQKEAVLSAEKEIKTMGSKISKFFNKAEVKKDKKNSEKKKSGKSSWKKS